jgi:hypothetical protein
VKPLIQSVFTDLSFKSGYPLCEKS